MNTIEAPNKDTSLLKSPSQLVIDSTIDLAVVFVASAIALLSERLAHNAEWIDVPESATGVSAVIAGVLAAIAVVVYRKQKLSELGFKRPERWATVPLWVVGIFLAFIAAQLALPMMIGFFFELPRADLSRYDSLYRNLPAAIAMACVLPFTASIPEEIIYRGFLLDRLIKICDSSKWGLIGAVAIQSVIFRSIHYQWGPGGMIVTTMMGAVWGTEFLLVKRNLWIVIMAHSLGHMAMVANLYFVKASEV